jgi:hypothetical protein
MTGPGCVVRFFERNDRIKKHLLTRLVLEGKSLEEGLAAAYHTLKQTSQEKKDTLLSIEIEIVNAPALVATGA